MKNILLGGAAALALATGGALFARTDAQPHPGHHKQTELRTDVQSHVAKTFSKFDANHDGFITDAELKTVETQRDAKFTERAEQDAKRFDPATIFARLDANKDGMITRAEADAVEKAHAQAKDQAKSHTAGLFARVDANKDSMITRAEFSAAAAQMHAHMEQAGMHHGIGGQMFLAADLNKDGKISATEMQQMALQHFDQADANHDGKLTPDERQQSRQAHRPNHKA